MLRDTIEIIGRYHLVLLLVTVWVIGLLAVLVLLLWLAGAL